MASPGNLAGVLWEVLAEQMGVLWQVLENSWSALGSADGTDGVLWQLGAPVLVEDVGMFWCCLSVIAGDSVFLRKRYCEGSVIACQVVKFERNAFTLICFVEASVEGCKASTLIYTLESSLKGMQGFLVDVYCGSVIGGSGMLSCLAVLWKRQWILRRGCEAYTYTFFPRRKHRARVLLYHVEVHSKRQDNLSP